MKVLELRSLSVKVSVKYSALLARTNAMNKQCLVYINVTAAVRISLVVGYI